MEFEATNDNLFRQSRNETSKRNCDRTNPRHQTPILHPEGGEEPSKKKPSKNKTLDSKFYPLELRYQHELINNEIWFSRATLDCVVQSYGRVSTVIAGQ